MRVDAGEVGWRKTCAIRMRLEAELGLENSERWGPERVRAKCGNHAPALRARRMPADGLNMWRCRTDATHVLAPRGTWVLLLTRSHSIFTSPAAGRPVAVDQQGLHRTQIQTTRVSNAWMRLRRSHMDVPIGDVKLTTCIIICGHTRARAWSAPGSYMKARKATHVWMQTRPRPCSSHSRCVSGWSMPSSHGASSCSKWC